MMRNRSHDGQLRGRAAPAVAALLVTIAWTLAHEVKGGDFGCMDMELIRHGRNLAGQSGRKASLLEIIAGNVDADTNSSSSGTVDLELLNPLQMEPVSIQAVSQDAVPRFVVRVFNVTEGNGKMQQNIKGKKSKKKREESALDFVVLFGTSPSRKQDKKRDKKRESEQDIPNQSLLDVIRSHVNMSDKQASENGSDQPSAGVGSDSIPPSSSPARNARSGSSSRSSAPDQDTEATPVSGAVPLPAQGEPPGSQRKSPGGSSSPTSPSASHISGPEEGLESQFFGESRPADSCNCTDAVPSGAFNCQQTRFQDECELDKITNGAPDIPEGFCQITCGRCECCPDLLTMVSRRGLDTFRLIMQTMADAEGSRSIAKSLQNPSFPATVFIPTNDAFSRLFSLLKQTREEFLNQPSLLNQIMTYHVLLGPSAATTEELKDGILGLTLATLNPAAFLKIDSSSDEVLSLDGVGSKANVLIPNVWACEAIFHVVDEVLLPFSPAGF